MEKTVSLCMASIRRKLYRKLQKLSTRTPTPNEKGPVTSAGPNFSEIYGELKPYTEKRVSLPYLTAF